VGLYDDEMKLCCLFILVLVGNLCMAQDFRSGANVDSIHLIHEKKVHFYFAPSFSAYQFSETVASFAGIYLGMIYQDHLDISLSYAAILNNFKKQIIFPSHHHYDQTNFGLQLQYSFFDKKIRPITGIGAQFLHTSWQPDGDLEDTFTDYIYTIKGVIGIAWLINRTFNLQGTAGYNVARDVEIVGLESNDYDGFAADFVLKIRFGQ